VTLGKRLGRNFYAAYERSLGGAVGTLFVFYDLTRRITIRAEAGERTAVDLIFTFTAK
jgi:translocation and assembly module TamB